MRKTYIGQGELLAVPVALSVLRGHLQGCLLTWYIDNASAAAAAIKGASPDADNAALALIGSLMAARLAVHVWIEHVASAQNPADIMTHAAFSDAGVHGQQAAGTLVAVQPAVPWQDLCSLRGAFQLIQRWG